MRKNEKPMAKQLPYHDGKEEPMSFSANLPETEKEHHPRNREKK